MKKDEWGRTNGQGLMISNRKDSLPPGSARRPNKAFAERLAWTNAGVVGVGLMGSSIAACLLAAGYSVAAVEVDAVRRRKALHRVLSHLEGLREEGLIRLDPKKILTKLTLSEHFDILRQSQIVIESVVEDLDLKKRVIRNIEQVVSPKTLIGSNTSAIPPTKLQEGALHPERILGIHWGEPAHVLRFMEIIAGKSTKPVFAKYAMAFARQLGKEPSLVRKDVRGFITNRVMYAMLREAFHLVESGVASIDDVDRSLRNDYGYWMTFAGPFRFMDLTGIPAYATVMRDLLPDLSCSKRVPRLMTKVVKAGAKGVSNAKGFYRYTPEEAKRWDKRFLQFSYEIRALAQKYEENKNLD